MAKKNFGLESPGVCNWDSGVGSTCTPIQKIHKFRVFKCNNFRYPCFLTSNLLQLYTSSLEKFCACETDCEIEYKYPLPVTERFLTLDAGQLYDINNENFCPADYTP